MAAWAEMGLFQTRGERRQHDTRTTLGRCRDGTGTLPGRGRCAPATHHLMLLVIASQKGNSIYKRQENNKFHE
ncbi:unnamed protein product, partial [Brenthis ino]